MSARLLYILRWFLELQRPAAYGTDAEIAAEVERNYRWNFNVNLLDFTTFFFGFSFISATTVVPLYISTLSDSPLPIGIAAVIFPGILIVMEFGPAEKRPTYAGLANTVVGVVSVAAPLVSVALGTRSYNLVFAIGVLVTLVGLAWLHWRVREPRKAQRPAAVEG